jgi:predicted nucleic acid-binding protein
VPFAVIAELRAGFHVGQRQRQNEATLDLFLRRVGVGALFADDHTTLHYASLYKQLRAQGTPIPINDLWIASLVVQHNLVLYTRDEHFQHLPQLRLM